MKAKLEKYHLILLIMAFIGCSEQFVEPPSIPNNIVIAWHSPGRGEVFLYNSTTDLLTTVSANVVDTAYWAFVSSFSHDGHELLFTVDYRKPSYEGLDFCNRDDIFSYNLITGETIRLTDNEYQEKYPRFSKDGEYIIFTSNENGNNDVFVIDRFGNNKRQLVSSPGYEHDPQFFLDDNKVLYASHRDGKRDLYLNDIMGENEEKLTDNDLMSEVSVSGDNEFFIYSGEEGIYKYYYNIRIPSLLLSHTNASAVKVNLYPRISKDSKYMVYTNTDSLWSHIYLYEFQYRSRTDLGVGFVADFTKDSQNVVFFNRDGIHLCNISTKTDSLLVPFGLSFNMVVSSIE